MTDTDLGKSIGDFRFGLEDDEAHARFTESVERDVEIFNEWGEIPEGTTFADVADVLIDTLFGCTSISSIPATEIPEFLETALQQLRGEEHN